MMGAEMALRLPMPGRARAARPDLAVVAEQHLGTVVRYLTGMVGDPVLAEDLAAATFETAVRTWSRYDPERASPAVWLCQVARSRALDHFRREGRRRARETRYASETPLHDPGPAEPGGLSAPMRAALARLSDAEREAVALRVILGLDTAEAAQVLDISPTACSSLLHRALTKLRREVGDARG